MLFYVKDSLTLYKEHIEFSNKLINSIFQGMSIIYNQCLKFQFMPTSKMHEKQLSA